MKVWTIMPVKPLVRSKSRLAPVLTNAERERLSLGMLLHNIHLLKTIPEIAGTLIISRDTKVLAVVRDLGVSTVQESGQPELNSALTRATDLLRSWGVDAVLVLPTDLPLLAAEDVRQMLHLGRFTSTVVIAPDDEHDGTNALLVNPPGILEYSYGAGSFDRHIRNAELVGATVQIYESERIAMDVDTPSDLERYLMLAEKYEVPVIDYHVLDPQN